MELRATYHNLKGEDYLNSLSQDDIKKLWLPYVIYDNTDMKEAVELDGGVYTKVTVTRQGEFIRSPIDVLDEIEIFNGDENKLRMSQTYTKVFQCEYDLSKGGINGT